MATDPDSFPAQQEIAVPPEYREHPLVRGKLFFTLPPKLWQRVVQRVGREQFDSALLALECELSDRCGDHTGRVGFWGGIPILFGYLRPQRQGTGDHALQELAGDENLAKVGQVLEAGIARTTGFTTVGRGYLGWLLTSRQFLQEHRQLFQKWSQRVAVAGIPQMGPVVRDARAYGGDVAVAEGEVADFFVDFQNFFVRWRLEGMPAPFAPLPIGPQLPLSDLRPVLGHTAERGTFFLPDTFPVPTRDQLREIVEEVLRGGDAADHLAGWSEIVKGDNAVKNKIPRYARVFEVQHYMRALYGRHASSLERKKSAVIVALSEFLGVSDGTIENDVNLIAGRLGSNDWFDRPA